MWFDMFGYLDSVLNVLGIPKCLCEIGLGKVIGNSLAKTVTQLFTNAKIIKGRNFDCKQVDRVAENLL